MSILIWYINSIVELTVIKAAHIYEDGKIELEFRGESAER